MKKRLLISTVATILVFLLVALAIFDYRTNRKKTEAYRQAFPDGERTLVISHVGEPIFPYGDDRIEVEVRKGRRNLLDTLIPVSNDGAKGRFTVDWKDGSAVVTLSGDEMEDIILTL